MPPRQLTCTACAHTFSLPAGSHPAGAPASCPKCGAPARSAAGARARSGEPARSSRSRAAAHPESSGRKTTGLFLAGGGALLLVAAFLFLRGGEEGAAPAQAAEPAAGVDLAALPDPPRLEGTTDEEWQAMNELVARYVTPPFGDESQKAGDRLMVRGKRAVPAMLAGFKRLDLTKRENADIGWKMQTLLLQGLCGDVNFGWHRDTRPEDVAFNQRVIQRWLEAWAKAGEDDAAWAAIRAAASAPAPAK